jgi:hypothetical protein
MLSRVTRTGIVGCRFRNPSEISRQSGATKSLEGGGLHGFIHACPARSKTVTQIRLRDLGACDRNSPRMLHTAQFETASPARNISPV